MTTRRALLIGSAGMLGSECLRSAPADISVAGMSRAELDIANLDKTLEALRRLRPDVVVNTAAYTAVDAAETDREAAFRVNWTGVRNLALACRDVGARLTHVSTDFVFDGTARKPYAEHDAANPRGAYATSKHFGELALADLGGDWQVVRTQWLYGARGKHFVGAIVKAARERDRLSVVADQRGCPTCVFDLAPELWRIALHGGGGVYHASAQGDATWHEFAVEIVRLCRLSTPVDAITTSEWAKTKPGAAPRPPDSVLGKHRLEQDLGARLPHWKEALTAFFERGGPAV